MAAHAVLERGIIGWGSVAQQEVQGPVNKEGEQQGMGWASGGKLLKACACA